MVRPAASTVPLPALDDAFHAEIRLRLPTCPVHLLEEPPAAGAALLALDRLGRVDGPCANAC